MVVETPRSGVSFYGNGWGGAGEGGFASGGHFSVTMMSLYPVTSARCHPEQGEGTEPVREGSPSFGSARRCSKPIL